MICGMDWMRQETRGKERTAITVITPKAPKLQDTIIF